MKSLFHCNSCGQFVSDMTGFICEICGDEVVYCESCMNFGVRTMPDGLPDFQLCDEHYEEKTREEEELIL